MNFGGPIEASCALFFLPPEISISADEFRRPH